MINKKENSRSIKEPLLHDSNSNNSNSRTKTINQEDPDPVEISEFYNDFTNSEKKYAWAAIICSLAHGTFLSLVILFLTNYTDGIGKHLNFEKRKDVMINQADQIWYFGIGSLFISLFSLILWRTVNKKRVDSARIRIMESILKKDETWFKQKTNQNFLKEFSNKMIFLETIYKRTFFVFFLSIGMLLSSLFLVFYKGWFIPFIFAPLWLFPFVILMYSIRYFQRQRMSESESYKDSRLISEEAFENIRTVKALNYQEHEIKKYNSSLIKHFRARSEFTWQYSLFSSLFYISITAIVTFWGYMGSVILYHRWNKHGEDYYTSGDVFGSLLFTLMIYFSIFLIKISINSINRARVIIAQINEITDDSSVHIQGTFIPNKHEIKGQIVFENVSFAYPEAPDQMVLKNISFKIEPGQQIAIVGPSGAGKSTILQLILRFYEPTEGYILLDGIDISTINLSFYRQLFGLIPRDPVLFEDTIEVNLKLGTDPDTSTSEGVSSVLELVKMKKFIEKKLSKGVQTIITNPENRLSRNQKQRLSIARELLRDSQVLLFDDVMKNLGLKSKIELQEIIDRAAEGKASISVTDNLESVENSDLILVLSGGEIKEKGTREELLENENGLFTDIFRCMKMQMEREESNDDSQLSLGSKNSQNLQVTTDRNSRKLSTRNYIKNAPKMISLVNFLTKKDYFLLACGFVISLGIGLFMPVLGVHFAEFLLIFIGYDTFFNKDFNPIIIPITKDDFWSNTIDSVNFVSYESLILFVVALAQFWLFSACGKKIELDLRKSLFRNLINKDSNFFDDPSNSPKKLAAALEEGCRNVLYLQFKHVCLILQFASSVLTCMGLGYHYSVKTANLFFLVGPLLLIFFFFGKIIFLGSDLKPLEEDKRLIRGILGKIRVLLDLIRRPSSLSPPSRFCCRDTSTELPDPQTSITFGSM